MSATFKVIPTAEVRPSTRNVRDDLGDLTELAASLRANGVQQPIIVTDQGGHYELVDGHRRHAAAELACLKVMPAIVTEIHGTRPTLVTMLAAAMHKQLTPLEQAKAFQTLMDDGMPIAAIVQATGYSRATINARLSLLYLPDEAQDMVADGTLKLGEAAALAREVKANRSGSVVRKQGTNTWLTNSHRLASVVGLCDHSDTRTLIGGVGCGQCWEKAIREDALTAEQAEPYDEAAVLRAVGGGASRHDAYDPC